MPTVATNQHHLDKADKQVKPKRTTKNHVGAQILAEGYTTGKERQLTTKPSPSWKCRNFQTIKAVYIVRISMSVHYLQ